MVWRSVLLMLCLAGCAREPELIKLHGTTMATAWNVTASQGVSAGEIQARLDELEQIFSNWRADSAVSLWNRTQSTDFVTVPKELAEVMDLALTISRQSDGALDVTIAPLIDLWGFGPSGAIAQAPSNERIEVAKAKCGWRDVEVRLDPPALRKKRPEITINVSTLVEGYASDEIARMLRRTGCKVFLVDVGGALVAQGKEWNVGLQVPGAAQGEAMTSVPLRDMAVTTAGTYRKHFEADGKRYAHILDPHTGRPVDHTLTAVSVFNASAVVADGWDTTLLVLGPVRGRELATKLGLRAVFIEERK